MWGLVAIVLVAIFATPGCGGDSGGPGDNAHINEDSGSTNGLLPDEREGTPPPPVKITRLGKAVYQSRCYMQLKVPAKNVKQVPPDAPAPEYEGDIPISGPFVEPPHQQADGAYLNMPDAVDQVGALNNGRLTIQYAPDLSSKIQLKLKGLYDTMYGAALFFPNDEMNYAVAATAWGNFLECPSWENQNTLDVIRAFGRQTWGKYGGEPVEDFPFTGPTPRDPAEPGAS